MPKLDFKTYGMFGRQVLRKLCDSKGANRPTYFGAKKISGPICMNSVYGDYYSTQWQIEQYIKKNILNCTNWTAIKQETAYNVTPLGEPNITVRLGLSDIDIEAKIPISIKVGGYEPIITAADFHTKLSVRLKRIGELASLISTYDSYVLNFNLSKDYKQFSNWDSYINVKVSTPFPPGLIGAWEDIIEIEDNHPRGLLNGKPFIFRFARQNRYPALDLIYQINNFTNYDLIVMENDTIILDPNPDTTKIYDPDEDNLKYFFTGWNEDCKEEYDFKKNEEQISCSKTSEKTHPSQRIFTASSPRKWSTSDLFKKTKRNTSYTTNRNDIGAHNVTVWVCDEAGLCDYQTVRILVFDYPIVFMNGSNRYSDIPDNYSSVEDPYQFEDGTIMYVKRAAFGVRYEDVIEPFDYVISPGLKKLELPRAGFNITNITLENFKKEKLKDTKTGTLLPNKTHTIKMSTTLATKILPYTKDIIVMQCLPHRSEKPPWPYNVTPSVFHANHACCSSGKDNQGTVLFLERKLGGVSNKYPYLEYNHNLDMNINIDTDVTVFRQDRNLQTGKLEDTCKLHEPWVCASALCVMPIPQPACAGQVIKVDTANKNKLRVWFTPTLSIYPEAIRVVVKYNGKIKVPQYGTYFDSNKICYSDDPKIGLFHVLNKLQVKSKYVGATTAYYRDSLNNPLIGATTGMYNDIIRQNFQRRCSGERGNICDGKGSLVLKSVEDCEDKKANEIESCVGPSYSFGTTGYQTLNYLAENKCVGGYPNKVLNTGEECDPLMSGRPPTAKCSASLCSDECTCPTNLQTIDPTSTLGKCVGYTGESFESKFGLWRADNSLADGTCSKETTCKNSAGVAATTGTDLCSGKGCSVGKCKEPKNCKPCNAWDGRVSYGSAIYHCTLPMYPATYPSLTTNLYTCASTSGKAACEIDTTNYDPDTNQNACTGCARSTNGMVKPVFSPWDLSRPTQKRCCGDDAGEGGYRYFEIWNYGPAATDTHIKATSNGWVQTAEPIELDCNDFYGSSSTGYTNPLSWIDNDCDGKANCFDTNCAGEKGVYGGVCCQGDSDCSAKLSSDSKCVKGNKHECDCESLGSTEKGGSFSNPIVKQFSSLVGGGFSSCTDAVGSPWQRYTKINFPVGKNSVNLGVGFKDVYGVDCATNQLRYWENENDYSTSSFIGNSYSGKINLKKSYLIVALDVHHNQDCKSIITIS